MAVRMLLIEAALLEERLERRRNRRRLRNSFNIREIPDMEFVGNYRLSRELFEVLCQEIVPLLPPKTRRHGIEPTITILTALNFYARGGYQGSVGQNMDGPMAQQTVSRCLKEVTNALNALIIACCVLHNLCIRAAGIDVPELTNEQLEAERRREVLSEPACVPAMSSQALQAGRRARDRLVQILERNRLRF